MDANQKLAELLFPQITKTPQAYEALYPPRDLPEGARVTRFAPSPTGFLHIGSLYPAMINKLVARSTGGVFYLRVEDTDAKREVENGAQELIEGLSAFDIVPDEGITPDGTERGAYGPYSQRARREIYQCYAKQLVAQGLAYPCFCTEDALNGLRDKQAEAGVNKGYYGEWALCRNLDFAAQEAALAAGTPYVLRLRSEGDPEKRIVCEDLIRGKLDMQQNNLDVVLLKADGIPTYHFAHAVDDHLMRTTHVIRGDEWIASLPLHLELFRVCGFKPPKYAHIAPLMKEEDGSKRKLSKRKDPEAAVRYFVEEGYPASAVQEYLMTLMNSNFEDWRRANPDAALSEFPFNLKKMSASGALFDGAKLADVSKNVISRMTAQEVFVHALCWVWVFDAPLAALLEGNPDFAKGIFAIDRGGAKPRKDIAKWAEIADYVAYFYAERFDPAFALPENIGAADAAAILAAYREVYCHTDDRDAWFARMKELCAPLGFTPNVKEYKQNPQDYKGHIGDVSTVIRLAITARGNTPDLYAITQLLGEGAVLQRLKNACHRFSA